MRILLTSLMILLLTFAAAFADNLVTMDVRDVEVRGLFGELGRRYGVNMVIGPDVRGSVTVSIKDMALADALERIAASAGFSHAWSGDTFVVGAAGAARVEKSAPPELVLRRFRISSGQKMDEAIEAARTLASKDALIMRLGDTIVVKDTPQGIAAIEAVLVEMTAMPVQVMIEAGIVEVSSAFVSEIGVEWGASGSSVSGDVLGGLGSMDGGFSVNLPAVAEGESGFAIGFGLVSDKASVDLRISALEDKGEAEIVSNPRVMVLEGREAYISDGAEILVPNSYDAKTIIQTGPGTSDGIMQMAPQTLDALLELRVRPRVLGDGFLELAITLRREEFDFSSDVQGYPPKQVKKTGTSLIIRDGQTVAIGGIKTTARSTRLKEVPVLSGIPLLGGLFRYRGQDESAGELVVFLTPRILEHTRSDNAFNSAEGDIQGQSGR